MRKAGPEILEQTLGGEVTDMLKKHFIDNGSVILTEDIFYKALSSAYHTGYRDAYRSAVNNMSGGQP